MTKRYTCPKCHKLALEVIKQMELRRMEAETEAMYEDLKNQKRVKTSPEIATVNIKHVAIFIVVWLFVALSVICLVTEFLSMAHLLPIDVPVYGAMGLCVLFGVIAFVLAGKL
jgi:uncharacterized membrane protein